MRWTEGEGEVRWTERQRINKQFLKNCITFVIILFWVNAELFPGPRGSSY